MSVLVDVSLVVLQGYVNECEEVINNKQFNCAGDPPTMCFGDQVVTPPPPMSDNALRTGLVEAMADAGRWNPNTLLDQQDRNTGIFFLHQLFVFAY